jgi:hypothetical protein
MLKPAAITILHCQGSGGGEGTRAVGTGPVRVG